MTNLEIQREIEEILDPLTDGQYAVDYCIFRKHDHASKRVNVAWMRADGTLVTALDIVILDAEIFGYNLIPRFDEDCFDSVLRKVVAGYADFTHEDYHFYENWEYVATALRKFGEWVVKELN